MGTFSPSSTCLPSAGLLRWIYIIPRLVGSSAVSAFSLALSSGHEEAALHRGGACWVRGDHQVSFRMRERRRGSKFSRLVAVSTPGNGKTEATVRPKESRGCPWQNAKNRNPCGAAVFWKSGSSMRGGDGTRGRACRGQQEPANSVRERPCRSRSHCRARSRGSLPFRCRC